jgi:hypothetical protein
MHICETCGTQLSKSPKSINMPGMVYRKSQSALHSVLKPTYFQPEEEVLMKIEEALSQVGVYLGSKVPSVHNPTIVDCVQYEMKDNNGAKYNRYLCLSFYRMESGRDEVIGYIS